MPSDVDLAWAAGFIDGEGCIYLNRERNSRRVAYLRPTLEVANTDPAPLVKLAEMFGGTIKEVRRDSAKHRNAYKWCLRGFASVQATLAATRPYMRVKGDEADIVLGLRVTGRGINADPGEMRRREEAHAQLADLKRRSYASPRGPEPEQ